MQAKIANILNSPLFWGFIAGGITCGAMVTHTITASQAVGYAVATAAALKVALGLQSGKS